MPNGGVRRRAPTHLLVKGGSDLLVGVTGLAGLLVLTLADLALLGYDRFGALSSREAEKSSAK